MYEYYHFKFRRFVFGNFIQKFSVLGLVSWKMVQQSLRLHGREQENGISFMLMRVTYVFITLQHLPEFNCKNNSKSFSCFVINGFIA